MGIEQFTLIILGALAGGFVSGLAGFGTGKTAISIWLLCRVATRRRFASRGVLGHSASTNPAHDLALYRSKAYLSFHRAGHIRCAARRRAALTPRYKNSQAHGRRSPALFLYIYVVWQNTCEEHMGRSLRGWYDWFRRWRSRGPCRLIGTAADDVGDDQASSNARSTSRTARRRAGNRNNGPWLGISSIGWDWAGVIRGSASRPRRPKLHTRPYAPRRRRARIGH